MIKQITFDKELRHRSSYLLHVQLTSLCNFKYRYIWTRRGLFLSVASIQTKMGVFIYWTLEILRWIFPLFIIKLTVLFYCQCLMWLKKNNNMVITGTGILEYDTLWIFKDLIIFQCDCTIMNYIYNHIHVHVESLIEHLIKCHHTMFGKVLIT